MNGNLKIDQIDKALGSIRATAIVLLQLEIPLSVVVHVLKCCSALGHHVILNPAPARKLNKGALKNLFLITPNESEAELLTGIKIKDPGSAER